MTVETAGNALLVVATIPAVLSVLFYMRVPWWRTWTGRHLMAFMFAFAAVMVLGCVRLLIGWNELFEWLRVVVFGGVPIVWTWRLALVIAEQRATGRRARLRARRAEKTLAEREDALEP